MAAAALKASEGSDFAALIWFTFFSREINIANFMFDLVRLIPQGLASGSGSTEGK